MDFAKSDYKKGLDSVIRLKYDANQYNTRNDIGRYLYSTNKLERRAFANKNAVLFSKSGANDIVVIKVTDAAKFKNYVNKLFDVLNIDAIKKYNLKYQFARKAKVDELIKVVKDIQQGIGLIRGGRTGGENFDIVYLTGPVFLQSLSSKIGSLQVVYLRRILDYDPPSAGSWFNVSHRLKNINLENALEINSEGLEKDSLKTLKEIKTDVKNYIGVIDAASYVLKVFRANNPAHKQIVSILRKSNPFQTDKFRSFIKTTIEDEEDLNLFIEDLKEQYQKNKYIIAKILHELEKHGIKYDIVKLILGDNPKEMLTTQTTSSSH